jgi:glycosyltransferase involved in cell wall biosynthesis
MLHRFNAYLSVGQRSREYLESFAVGGTRIFHSPHCVDNESFAQAAAPFQLPERRAAVRAAWGLAPSEFVVMFAGKVVPFKRLQDLICAVSRLGSSAALLVVGSGPLEASCRDQAAQLGARVIWAGFLNQSEITRAYAAADCLCLPSNASETWGLVVNEAMATGLPCVVSDKVGCAPDMTVPAKTGEVFEMGNAVDLAAALERVRALRAAGHDYRKVCTEHASRYSFAAATTGLVGACDSVRRPGAAPRVIGCCGGMVIVAGLERMTFEGLSVLREQGASVHCIVNDWENFRIVELAKRIGASWTTAPYRCKLDRRERNPLRFARMIWDIAVVSWRLLRDASRFRPTQVFLPEFGAVLRNAPALALLRAVGMKVVLRLGNAVPQDAFYRRVFRIGVDPFVDRYITNSRYTEASLLAHGIAPSKSTMIHNTCPERTRQSLAVCRDVNRIAYVGQVIPEKGVDLLLDAAGILVAHGLEPQLDIVGNMQGWGTDEYIRFRQRLIERASRPDLEGRVHFLGWREDVPDILAGASIHCCPSLPAQLEGFGIVNLEAKRSGIPSVVTPVGALPELIRHQVDGWIARDVSAEALAEGLEFFLSDPHRLERAGRAARESLQAFSREQFARAWCLLFGISAGICSTRQRNQVGAFASSDSHSK